MNTAQQIEKVIEELAGLQLQQDKLLEELSDLTKKAYCDTVIVSC